MIRRAVPILLALAALLAAGCGSGEEEAPPPGATIAGPGLRTTMPPWKPEYAHLPQRLRQLGLPPVGDERFHIHAMVHVYVDGLLSPVPTDIGIDGDRDIESSMHTHDGTGVVHMEASRPHRFTLGDFFSVWGVKLGPDRVGGLTGLGGDRLHFLINGRTLRDPASYVLRDGDNVVIGYGPLDSFPHVPSTEPLEAIEDGDAVPCGETPDGKRAKSCFAPERDDDRR